MQASGGGKVLTGKISFARFTGAAAEPLPILADEEVNEVLIAVLAVRHTVLPKYGCRLDEKVGSFGAFGGFGELGCADEFNHFSCLRTQDCQLH